MTDCKNIKIDAIFKRLVFLSCNPCYQPPQVLSYRVICVNVYETKSEIIVC